MNKFISKEYSIVHYNLYIFLKDYLDWVDSGTPNVTGFYSVGLCRNFAIHSGIGDSRIVLSNEFLKDGLHRQYPFNIDYKDYVKEVVDNRVHLNKYRMQWVKDKVNQYEAWKRKWLGI